MSIVAGRIAVVGSTPGSIRLQVYRPFVVRATLFVETDVAAGSEELPIYCRLYTPAGRLLLPSFNSGFASTYAGWLPLPNTCISPFSIQIDNEIEGPAYEAIFEAVGAGAANYNFGIILEAHHSPYAKVRLKDSPGYSLDNPAIAAAYLPPDKRKG